MASDFTRDQRRAIELRGNVLVVAGAGTGKTKTLVERCVNWLLASPENSLDHVLMVTFTEAAAAEMRQRIRVELQARQLLSPHDGHLIEQLALLETAFISTLHSFCFRLVRQHFYELDLDPQLAVLAEEEARLLAAETLTDLLEAHYAGDTPRDEAVRDLIQVQARGRDLPVRRLVLRLHQFTQTLPNASDWFDAQHALFSNPEPNVWRDWLCRALADWRDLWIPVLRDSSEASEHVADCLAALERLPLTSSIDLELARPALGQNRGGGSARLAARGEEGGS